MTTQNISNPSWSTSENSTACAAIEALEVGQSRSWPIFRMRSIRSLASQIGMLYDRKYSTKCNKETREIVVVRLS